MTVYEVKEILKGTFDSQEDKQYWVNKLEELIVKERIAKENKKYFKKMAIYDR